MATAIAQTNTGDLNIDGLFSGFKWSGTVTYSFPDSISDYPASYGGSLSPAGFAPVSANEKLLVDKVMTYVEDITTDIVIMRNNEAGISDGAADIRIARLSAANPTAFTYYPSNAPDGEGGDVWIGTSNTGFANPLLGDYAYFTHLHEIGHALGLKHPHVPTADSPATIPVIDDGLEYSVMSYRSFPGQSLDVGHYTNETRGYPQSFMRNDIAALQEMYGADFSYHSGNDVYSWSPTSTRIFLTIWDGGGNDTYDMSNYTTGVTINLEPGSWSVTSSDQKALLGYYDIGQPNALGISFAQGNVYNAFLYHGDTRSLIENAIGSSGGDTITGNAADNHLEGRSGKDTLSGGAGNDWLEGGNDADNLNGGDGNDLLDCGLPTSSGAINNLDIATGGAGDDRFVFRAGSHISVTDFAAGGSEDKIYFNFQYVHSFAFAMTAARQSDNDVAFDFGGQGSLYLRNFQLGNLTADDFLFSNPQGEGTAAPTDIVLSLANVRENEKGASVGNLTVTDPDGDTDFIFEVSDSRFEVQNDWAGHYILKLKSGIQLDNETEPSIELDIQATDAGGFSFQKHFTLTVKDGTGATIIGTPGADLVDATHTVAGQPLPTEDNDTLQGMGGNDTLYGLSGQDIIMGGDGSDQLYGGDGHDTLMGSTGNDFLYGGAGNDTLYGESGVDYLDGGDGNDTFNIVGSDGTFDTILGGDGIDNFGSQGDSPIILQGFSPDNSLEIFWGFCPLWGTDTANILDFSNITAAGSTKLSVDGRAGNDTIVGNAGSNELDGGSGNDTLTGGAGDDLFFYRNLGGIDVITDFTAGGSLDQIYFGYVTGVRTFYQATLFATQQGDDTVFDFGNGQMLTLLDVALGDLTADDFAFSNPLPPSKFAPSDIVLAGNAVPENDAGRRIGPVEFTDADGETEYTFNVSDNRFEVVTIGSGYYWLSLKSGVSIDYETEPSVTLEITVTDSGGLSYQEEFTLNVLDRPGATITGTSGNNAVNGAQTVSGQELAGEEDDTINGMAGNDTLSGLGGDDTISGGTGNDILDGGDGNDNLYGQAGVDNINGGAGNDKIYITGTEASTDTMQGGDGVDSIVVTGTAAVTLAGFGPGNFIEVWTGNNAVLLGTSAANVFDLNGLTSRSGLLYVDGAGGNDTLIGGALADDLRGGAGNDSISGGEGNDSLYGGAGVDNINGGADNDTIYIAGSEASGDAMQGGDGTDTLQVLGTGSVTLGGFGGNTIEIWGGNNAAVLGTKTGNILDFSGLTSKTGLGYIDGGGGNDTITGTGFADDLRGNSGNDILNGGGGNDLLNGGKGVDTFVFNGDFGNDTVVGFTAGTTSSHDIIQFDDAQFSDFADVMANALQVGTSVVITLDGNNSVTLQSVTLLNLVAADFQFV